MDHIEIVQSTKDPASETVAEDRRALLVWTLKTIHIHVMLAIWAETKR